MSTSISSDPDAACAAPLLWPVADVHHVVQTELEVLASPRVDELNYDLQRLARLADSVRSLQRLDGSFIHDVAVRELLSDSADLLARLSQSSVFTAATRTVLEHRAGVLRGTCDHRSAALLEAEIATPQELTIVCGPICTWRLKTHAPLHSMIAATARPAGQEIVAAADRLLGDALTQIREWTGIAELDVQPPYPLLACDLIACGGEANSFPKHFAYFLPEDEGVDGAAKQKTLVFQNVYGSRHRLISRPLGDALLSGPRPPEAGLENLLLLWMRGHDVGHGVVLPSTVRHWRDEIGIEPYMMLQEAIADVFGFLLAASDAWSSIGTISLDALGAVFMAELLHYLRRGPWLFGDAGAAYLELAFLLEHGYVTVCAEDDQIVWDPPRLLTGMTELARRLVAHVVEPCSPGAARILLARHGWQPESPMAGLLQRLRTEFAYIPTTAAYADTTVRWKVR